MIERADAMSVKGRRARASARAGFRRIHTRVDVECGWRLTADSRPYRFQRAREQTSEFRALRS